MNTTFEMLPAQAQEPSKTEPAEGMLRELTALELAAVGGGCGHAAFC